MSDPKPEILCHCHLRWDWVWQRPQHVLTRLARDYRVWVEEEPIEDGRPAGLDIHDVHPGVTVIRPHRPRGNRSADIGAMVEGHVRGRRTSPELVRWFYSPMFSAYPGRLAADAGLVVYDCMDELSGFAGAPRDLPEIEARLLKRADVVFTGGTSLYDAKKARNPDVHCFPSAVEEEHFARALDGDLPVPADIADLPRPILGYYGVVDERLDYKLLAALAADPRVGSVVLVGPMAKVNPAALPRGPKLHYLGKRDYADLPAYCKGFDVCIMPWALNDATRHISPTKTLEYMAAGKPIVSTPVPDVVRNHGDLVFIADCAGDFAASAAAAACNGEHVREAGRRRARENSWDATVERMNQILLSRLARRNGCRLTESAV